MARLNNWSVVASHPSNPSKGWALLGGIVEGHNKLVDGEVIITSVLIMLNPDKKEAQTQNTHYELGQPNPEWIDWLNENKYPFAAYYFDMRN